MVDLPLACHKAYMAQVSDFDALMDLQVPEEQKGDIAPFLNSLNEHKIQQVLRLSYQDGDMVTAKYKKLIHPNKCAIYQ